MAKIIRLTESQLNKIIKRVLVEGEKEKILKEDQKDRGGNTTFKSGLGGTNTSSAGAYVTPGGINFTNDKPGGANDRTYTEQPSLRYGGDGRNPYDDDNPRRPRKKPPTSGSYVTSLRSTECCKKCKNGKFKHNCDGVAKGKLGKFDSTNCVYATYSDCQLNKRSKPGNISKSKKKSKK